MTPQISSAAALLMLRSADGTSLKGLSQEIAAMHTSLTGEKVDPKAIRSDLHALARQMAQSGYDFYVTDAPDLTDDVGKVKA